MYVEVLTTLLLSRKIKGSVYTCTANQLLFIMPIPNKGICQLYMCVIITLQHCYMYIHGAQAAVVVKMISVGVAPGEDVTCVK